MALSEHTLPKVISSITAQIDYSDNTSSIDETVDKFQLDPIERKNIVDYLTKYQGWKAKIMDSPTLDLPFVQYKVIGFLEALSGYLRESAIGKKPLPLSIYYRSALLDLKKEELLSETIENILKERHDPKKAQI